MAFNFFQKFIGRRGQKQEAPAKKTEIVRGALKHIPRQDAKKESSVHEARSADRSIVIKGKSDSASVAALLPHISEKATRFQYVFRVSDRANKPLLKKAVEDRYDVKVSGVRIINTHGRTRRRGNAVGFQSGYKKALVTLRKGYSIEEL